MSQVYLIADTHFGGDEIIRYENRPFATVDEMTQCFIANWNETVTDEDTIYVLGDFSTNQTEEEDQAILKELRGNKILIMGNHDQHRTPEQWRNLGFAECSQWPILYQNFFLLSHEPLYINQNMPYANIYGHVHGNVTYQSVTGQSACVCVERLQYTPIAFEELVERMKKVLIG